MSIMNINAISPVVGCIAKKIQMSRMIVKGCWVGVTLLWVPKMTVIGTKVYENKRSLQIGVQECRSALLPKPQRAECEKLQIPALKIRKEFRCTDDREFQPGETISPADVFEIGQTISVGGITIGRGMSGVIKRHNFSGGNASHGTSKAHRQMGSTGCNTHPGRVFKNKKMPGHYGCERVTHHGITVIAIDSEHEIIALAGSVPGKEGWVELKHRGC